MYKTVCFNNHVSSKEVFTMSKPDNPGNRPDQPPGRPENPGNRPDQPLGRPTTPPRPHSRPVG